MHVVDDIDGVHIQFRHIGQNLLVISQHLGIVQHLILVRLNPRNHLDPLLLIYPAVNGIEQAFGQIGPGAKELHLLAHCHSRHTAGNAVIIAIHGPHQLIALVLDGIGLYAHLCTVPFKALRQTVAPQHRQVGLRSGTQVGKGMEVAEGVLSDQRAAVHPHTANGLGHPGGVPTKQFIILRGTQMAHQTQLNHKLVNQLLCPRLVQHPPVQIPLDINVQEGGGTAQRGGCSVVLLNACQVGQV